MSDVRYDEQPPASGSVSLGMCTMCGESPATTRWGAPVCQPCATWLGGLDAELQVEEAFDPALAEKARLIEESAQRYYDQRTDLTDPDGMPTQPLLPRVERRYRMAFERTPNRIEQRRWARQRSSSVYLVVERRERRYSRCIDRAMRRAMGDDNYEMLLMAMDPANDPPPLDKDPVYQRLQDEGFFDA